MDSSNSEMSGIGKHFYFNAYHKGNFKDKNHPDNVKHLHKWKVIFRCKAPSLNKENVVTDFRIVENLKKQLHNQYLNELKIFEGKTVTTEYLAKWICKQIPNCFLVEVFETKDNMAWYHR